MLFVKNVPLLADGVLFVSCCDKNSGGRMLLKEQLFAKREADRENC